MKVLFFAAVIIFFAGCSEKPVRNADVPDAQMPEKKMETGSAPLENAPVAGDESPDISGDLQKLRKIPGEESTGDCTGYSDRDGDGFGTNEKTVNFNCSGSAPVGYARESGDCNDRSRYIHPKAEEVCNGFDDNCDGVSDPEDSKDCNKYYADSDEDGYGAGEPKCLCVSVRDYPTLEAGDCDDSNRKVYPLAKESCNGLDDNCSGEVDEGEDVKDCRAFYVDNDGDGFGYDSKSKCLCKAAGIYKAEMIGDCNDNNPAIYPGAREFFDGIDNNCNGVVDENPGTPYHKGHK